jgi:hypothetical protein
VDARRETAARRNYQVGIKKNGANGLLSLLFVFVSESKRAETVDNLRRDVEALRQPVGASMARTQNPFANTMVTVLVSCCVFLIFCVCSETGSKGDSLRVCSWNAGD